MQNQRWDYEEVLEKCSLAPKCLRTPALVNLFQGLYTLICSHYIYSIYLKKDLDDLFEYAESPGASWGTQWRWVTGWENAGVMDRGTEKDPSCLKTSNCHLWCVKGKSLFVKWDHQSLYLTLSYWNILDIPQQICWQIRCEFCLSIVPFIIWEL